jgi:chromosome condensin MukBEF ATPase and DNA-binding subunit MukB
VRKEIQRTCDLCQQEKLAADGFSKFYAPLEEQRKQLEAELLGLEAQVDILKVNSLSAEEIAAQASSIVRPLADDAARSEARNRRSNHRQDHRRQRRNHNKPHLFTIL